LSVAKQTPSRVGLGVNPAVSTQRPGAGAPRLVADPSVTPAGPAAVEAWQRDVLAVLRQICHLLERRRPPARLTHGDRARLTALLPAIAGALGSDWFTAREILESDAPAVRVVRGALTARQIGRLLQRAEAATVEGYVVERGGFEVGATLWRVLATP